MATEASRYAASLDEVLQFRKMIHISCPTSDFLVTLEPSAPGPVERRQYQRHDDHRENCVRTEQCQVKIAHRALSGEARDTVVSVVPDIAAEKKRGGCKRRKHTNLMSLDYLTTNEEIAKSQQESIRARW